MQARVTVEQGVANPAALTLEKGQAVSLGRSRENTVVLHDEHASRHHAQIYPDNGGWFLRDLGTLNGTFVNGEKITQAVRLQHNQVIGIADMRLRFRQEDSGLLMGTFREIPSKEPRGGESSTMFWADELAALYEYMTATMETTDPDAVIEQTLQTVVARTHATLGGFLNLDEEDPLSKKVFPQSAEVNIHLSRHLTRHVQQTGRIAWMQAGLGDAGSSDSIVSYQDAVCIPLRAEGIALGALHVYKDQATFNEREVRFCEMVAAYASNSLARMRRFRALEAENSRLRLHTPLSEELVGASAAIKALRQTIARAAASNATVLIRGETGVGKELVALALHRQSPRCKGPLVVANCGAIVKNLFESELFGHCKGAFTNAVTDHHGLFQQADDGTLFLDEIGDMPLEEQIKLLRAIEGKVFRPVGATRDVRADVRVIAATNKDLEAEVKDGNFREDLYYRLRVVYIQVPPLRGHADDIPALVEHFLRLFAGPQGRPKTVSAQAMRRLQEYSWPGNVRQLRAALENAVIMGDGDTIHPENFSLPDSMDEKSACLKLADVEARAIARALETTAGNITRAAKLLGIARDTLHSKIKHYKLGEYLKE
jgi:two-component system, NtrC family, response regulator HydG